ncbi:MAG: mechanosensitive ion channel family protein [Candidatus Bathyarchaeota archaeon]|nr:mechanosensitive ion channel family protein [Candidatus Bathyarchaeota archaeon]
MAIWDDLFSNIPHLITLIQVAVVVVVAIVLERVLTRYVRRFVKGRELPPDVGNGLGLVFRLFILVGALIALLAIGGVPPELLVSLSALGGAAVGFASSRTIGNFISGLFVLILRPFRVHDYVRIGNVEGIVEEITINYTKIRTPSNTTVLISNQRTLDQDIINYRCEESRPPLYCYGIELTFDYSIPINKLEKTFDDVIQKYTEKLPRKPWYAMSKITSFARHYMFYLYVESPEDIFNLPSVFVKDLTETWEKAKAKT